MESDGSLHNWKGDEATRNSTVLQTRWGRIRVIPAFNQIDSTREVAFECKNQSIIAVYMQTRKHIVVSLLKNGIELV